MAPSERMKRVFSVLDKLGLQYMVGGSYASSTWGLSRQTNDLDLVLDLPTDRVQALVDAFETDYSLNREEVERAIQSSDPFRDFQLLDNEGYFKIDVFLLNRSAYDLEEFSRRVPREMIPGVVAPCCTAEDIIIRKLQWFVLGNKISDRQWNDILNVLAVRHDLLDYGYLDRWAGELGLDELLSKAVEETAKRLGEK